MPLFGREMKLDGILSQIADRLTSCARNGSLRASPTSQQEAPHGSTLRSLAAHHPLSSHRVYRQLYHAHAAAVPQRGLPEDRRRESPSCASCRGPHPWALRLSILHPAGDEIARDDREIQAGTGRNDYGIPQRSARAAEISRNVVCLLPADQLLRGLPDCPHGRAGRVLPGSVSSGRDGRVPRLWFRDDEQRHLERPDLELHHQRSNRWLGVCATYRRNLRLALAALEEFTTEGTGTQGNSPVYLCVPCGDLAINSAATPASEPEC